MTVAFARARRQAQRWVRRGGLSVGLLLVACAPLPPAENVTVQAVHCEAPWRLHGRIALRRGSESDTALLEWQHRANQDRLKFSGPLGQGAVQLTVTGQHVLLDRGDGRPEHFATAEQWLQSRFGVALPVAALRHWVCGEPYPRWPHYAVDQGFVQNDWLVTFNKFNERDGWRWPALIAVMQPGLSVKLAIDDWVIEHEQ